MVLVTANGCLVLCHQQSLTTLRNVVHSIAADVDFIILTVSLGKSSNRKTTFDPEAGVLPAYDLHA